MKAGLTTGTMGEKGAREADLPAVRNVRITGEKTRTARDARTIPESVSRAVLTVVIIAPDFPEKTVSRAALAEKMKEEGTPEEIREVNLKARIWSS